MLKKVLLSLMTCLLLLLSLEVAARLVFFQRHGHHAFAIADAVESLRKRYQQGLLARRTEQVLQLQEALHGIEEVLYGPQGDEVRAAFTAEYESIFSDLANAVRQIGSRFVVVYLPSRLATGVPTTAESFCRGFYHRLCEAHAVEFIDLTAALDEYPVERVTLLPENGHLSRFGNQVVAGELNAAMIGLTNRCRIAFVPDSGPFGDLAPNASSVWHMVESMPYFVAVNREGFRMNVGLDHPKRRTRVLCLGDSFTFGPFLPNHDTYPALWGRLNPALEVINAGICGYTIMDEYSLFVERAQYSAPDITVLQVLDNDIMGLFSFKKNEYDRKQRRHKPTDVEQQFTDRVRAMNLRQGGQREGGTEAAR